MIALVLLIGISVFILYFNKFNVDTKNAKIEIYYRSELIDSVDFEEKIDIDYTIETSDNNSLMVIKNNNGDITTKYITITQSKYIKNEISIDYEKIEMTYANCDNQLCMHMKMNRSYTLPIVCTNGITIMFVPNDELEGIVP